MVRLLLTRGAHVDARDSFGETPLYWAAEHHALGVAQLLLEHGADPRARKTYFTTPIEVAGARGDTAMVMALREHRPRNGPPHEGEDDADR